MTKKTFNQWRYDTVAIGGSGDVYQFTSEAYVSVYLGWGVSEAANASNNRVIVDGTIVGDPSYGGIESLGNRFALDIGQSGIVMGGIGVSSAGAKAQIDNLGYIIASTDYGVIASGNGFSLHNGGLIEGVGGVDVSGDNVTLVNAAGGLIKSSGRGIFIESASKCQNRTTPST